MVMNEPVQVIYFTDPLCSWCWAFEPAWRRLRFEFSEGLRWQYRAGGLLPGWGRYYDPINEIHNPGQMATQWLQVGEMTGVPIDPGIWEESPPASSYPACLACKAAERLGLPFAEAYLRRLREAVMLERRDISQRAVLIELAVAAGAEPEAFTTAFDGPDAADALRSDLSDGRCREIRRFPTLILHRTGPMGLALLGCRPYKALREAVARVAPELQPEPIRGLSDLPEYVGHWGTVTAHEIAVNFGIPADQVERELAHFGLDDNLVGPIVPVTSPS